MIRAYVAWRDDKSPSELQIKGIQLKVVMPIPGEVLQVTLRDAVQRHIGAANKTENDTQPDHGGGEENEDLVGVAGLVGVEGVGPPA